MNEKELKLMKKITDSVNRIFGRAELFDDDSNDRFEKKQAEKWESERKQEPIGQI